MAKIGFFSGTFDPVHAGHIAFALKAIEIADLDNVIFIPEAVPRRKEGVTHYAHRVAMLRLALKPHPKLGILDLPDKQFTVNRTLPRLRQRFPEDELHLLVGSDIVDMLISPQAIEQWPDLSKMLEEIRLIVAVRASRLKEEHRQKIDRLQPQAMIFASGNPHTSSRDIRTSIGRSRVPKDLLPSLRGYVKENWLYAAISD